MHEVTTEAPREGQFVQYPGSPFELFQPYPPAGDQPAAIDALVEGIRNHGHKHVMALPSEKQLAEMAAKGAKINAPGLTPFRDAVKPTYEKAKGKWGADTDAILADAAAVRKELPVKK